MAAIVVTQPTTATVAPMPANVQNVQVINTNQPLDIGRQYAKIYFNLGVTQVVLGAISVIIGITLVIVVPSVRSSYIDPFSLFGTGIWCGIFFLVSGSIGIASGKKPQYCLIVAGMVMSIFSALAASILVGLEVPGAISSTAPYYYSYYQYNGGAATALHSILAIIGFAEFIIAIVHSSYCCKPTCCTSQPQQMVYMAPVPTYAGQIPVQTTAIPGQQVTYVYQGQPNTVMQANQQPMYCPTGAVPPTNQQPNMIYPQAAVVGSPPPAYQGTDEKTQMMNMP